MDILYQMEIFVSKLYYKGKWMWRLRDWKDDYLTAPNPLPEKKKHNLILI